MRIKVITTLYNRSTYIHRVINHTEIHIRHAVEIYTRLTAVEGKHIF
jgi:hypothetical protein